MTIGEILSDKSRGSTSLYQDALKVFISYSDKTIVNKIKRNCEQLKDCFPVMGLFQNLYNRVNNLYEPEDMRMILNELTVKIASQKKSIYAVAQLNIPNNSSIITISHSSLVYEALLGGNHTSAINHVYCLKSGPMNEGINLCSALINENISASVIPDSYLLATFQNVDLVMVGCDLLTNNFFINKSGTAEVARIAITNDIPFWIVAEKSRFISNFDKPNSMDHIFEIIELENFFYILSEMGLTKSFEYIRSAV